MIGTNQPNVVIFELVRVTRFLSDGPAAITSLALHPLLVAPEVFALTSRGRETISQTDSGSHVQRADRAFPPLTYSGTFGVEPRSLGTFAGTGEQRFFRFFAEIVSLGSATSKARVQEILKGNLNVGIIGFEPEGFGFALDGRLSTQLASFNPDVDALAVNIYDFYTRTFGQVIIPEFSFRREHKQGGATGNIPYQMTVQYAGPLLVSSGGVAVKALHALVSAYPTWRAAIEAVETYTVPTILDILPGVAVFAAGLASSATSAVISQIKAIASLSGASSIPPGANLPNVAEGLGMVASLKQDVRDTLNALRSTFGIDGLQLTGATSGAIDWSTAPTDQVLDIHDAASDLTVLERALAFPPAAGKLQGLSSEQWQRYVASVGSSSAGPVIRDSFKYRVGSTDTPTGVQAQFGVAWADILDANGLTPDEALQPGVELEIPTLRQFGPTSADDLPILGSHVGEEALGRDLAISIHGSSGDIETVVGVYCLAQAMTLALEEIKLQTELENIPVGVQRAFIDQKIRRIAGQDKRVASVERVLITQKQAGNDIQVSTRAITGQEVRSG